MKKKYILGAISLVLIGTLLFAFTQEPEELQQGEPISEEERSYVSAPSIPIEQIYVSPYWLHSVLSSNQEESTDFVVIECSPDAITDTDSYITGHIEGAFHLDMSLLEDPDTGLIRSAQEIGSVFSSYGITKHTTVIFYSELNTDRYDDRAATIALWAGITNVKCLDGGIADYTSSGFPTETYINTPEPTDTYFGVEIPGRPEVFISRDEVLANIEDEHYQLVSIRSYDEFNGTSSGDRKVKIKGEIEGAVWGRDVEGGYYQNLDGTTIDLTELNRILIPYDVSTDDNHLSFYGLDSYSASVPYLIAYQNNAADISIFDGGWKEWITHPENPIQIGEPLSIDIVHTTVSGE